MRPLAPAFAALLALLLPAASLQQTTQFGVDWVLAEPREAHAEACLRVGKAPTSTVVGLTGAAWDLAAMGKVAAALGQEIAEKQMPSCCVASMWCSDHGGCYTHALGARYVNQGWLSGSEDRPVYTCQGKSGTSPSISKVVVAADDKQQKALVVGSHLGRDNNAVTVSIAGETCSDPEICSGACRTCGPNLPCADDQICLSSTTYGQSLNCYTYCAGPQDTSCPCGLICDSVTVIQTKGTVQRAIPTHLCTPRPFASANGAPCRDIPHESLVCEVPHYTALAADLSAVSVGVAVPHAGAVGTYSLPAIQCASDADCDDKNACTVDRCDLGRSRPACVHTARPECASQDQATLLRNRPFTYVLVAMMSRNQQQEEFAEQIYENSKPNSLSERDDAPLLHAKLRAPFPFFGNYYDEAWLNPNGLIQLPPHSSCSDVYGTIACITYSTESNTISVFGHNWDPSNSNAAKVYSDFPKSGDVLMHVLYDKVRPLGAHSSSSENTFSTSLYTDGSILNRYHTIRTTATETDKVGLWGARTTSTQYYEESTPLQLVDDGIDTAFCLQSTLACVQNACVTKGDVLKLRWDGVSCAAIGEEFPVLYECEFAGGAASTEADLDDGFLSCQVPDLSQIVPQNESIHVTAVKIRWTVPQAIVNFRTDGRQDVVGMLRDANSSTTMYTSLFIRYSLRGDRTECGCSVFEGLETATCDFCSVCNGVNSSVDCAGTCHGSAAVDRCGVCAGGTTGNFPGATCKTNPTIVTEDQIALLSQTLLLLLMLCCMTFTFASCKYFIQSAFHNSRRMDVPPPPGLLRLSTRRGLAAEEVDNLPLVRFRSPSVDSTHSDMDEVDDVESSLVHAAVSSSSRAVQSECAICLQDFSEGDECRRLPCGHMFHVPCVDEWLQMSLLCPMCKRNIRDQL